MTFGEMLSWTNRLKEVRNVKDAWIRSQRMRNLRSDFLEAYGWGEGIRKSNNPYLLVLNEVLDHEHFLFV